MLAIIILTIVLTALVSVSLVITGAALYMFSCHNKMLKNDEIKSGFRVKEES